MSTTYHCDRCGLEAEIESGRLVVASKYALGVSPDGSLPSESAQKDLCGDCLALLAAFLEPISPEPAP